MLFLVVISNDASFYVFVELPYKESVAHNFPQMAAQMPDKNISNLMAGDTSPALRSES